MTEHCFHFVRNTIYFASAQGPVLDIGSYIEDKQEHLDFRLGFVNPVRYVGVDVIPPSGTVDEQGEKKQVMPRGVDRNGNVLDREDLLAIAKEIDPKIILCLYVLEHVWEIGKAAENLSALWNAHPQAWMFVSTHQNQPFHGTINYPDYWRITASGLRKLFADAGTPDPHVFVSQDTSNPEDVVVVRQPISMDWKDAEAIFKNVINATMFPPRPRWETYE